LEGEEIKDAAADCKVTSAGDGGETFVTVFGESFSESGWIEDETGFEVSAIRE
jgi:hypothetical protein